MTKDNDPKQKTQTESNSSPDRTPLLPQEEKGSLEDQMTCMIPRKRELQVTLDPDTRYEYLDRHSLQAADDKDRAELGRGGFGRVLISFDQNIGREVAVKELLPQAQSGYLTRFLFEARITGQLDHPNIVPVYEIGTRRDGSHYYTMKLVRGRTLADAVADAAGLEDRLKLLGHFEHACHAIAYAHSKGVIHRDIKPMNIMIGEYGETVVLDWGIAKVLGEEDPGTVRNGISSGLSISGNYVTLDGKVIGTPKYMSPEQKCGHSERIDEKSDVWSLGAVLYEILTGHPPFHDLTPLRIINETRDRTVPSVQSLCPQAPSELAAIADKALGLNKADRYPNAKALADEIEAWRSGLRVSAYEYSPWELVKKFVTHNQALSAIIGLALLIFVVSSGLVYQAYRSTETARRQEVEARVQAQANERNANYNLSVAYYEKAMRESTEKNYLGASVFSAAAMKLNPDRPEGSSLDEPGSQTPGSLVREQRLAQQSCFYHAFFNRVLTHFQSLGGHSDTIYEMAFHPKSGLLASGGRDSTIRIWDPALQKEAVVLKGHESSILALAFSRDGKALASAGRDGRIKIWELASNKLFREISLPGAMIFDVAYSPDGSYFASSDNQGHIRIWRLPDYADAGGWESKSGTISSISFSPDSSILASAGAGETIRLWSVPDGKPIGALAGYQDHIERIAFSPDGQYLASGGRDQKIRLWELSSRKQIAVSDEHKDWVWSVSFSKDGAVLASCSRDYTIKLWHVPSLTCLNTVKRSDIGKSPEEVLFSPDGGLLASSFDKTLFLWKVAPSLLENTYWGSDRIIIVAKISPQGRALASASFDRIFLWATGSPRDPAILEEKDNLIRSVDFSPDERLLVSAGDDRILRVYDLSSKAIQAQLPGHEGRIFSAAFWKDGDLIASGGDDKTVRLWSLKDRKEVRRFVEHNGRVNAVAFSPDGAMLASGSADQSIILRDVKQQTFLAELKDHPDEVKGLKFSPDGKRLLSLFRDGTMQVWDMGSRTLEKTLREHSAWVNSAGFSPDGKRLVSGGDDRKLIVWDLEAGTPILLLEFPNQITFAAFTPDGARIAFNDDHEIKFFPASFDLFGENPEKLLSEAELAAGFALNPHSAGSDSP